MQPTGTSPSETCERTPQVLPLGVSHLDAFTDMHGILRGQATHVRGLFPEGMLPELLGEAEELEDWSTHQKANSWGVLTDRIFAHLEDVFGMSTVAGRRFNVYRSGEGKPLHQDRNARSDSAGNITVTASFGAQRSLRMTPLFGEDPLKIWQRDGDVFCFTSQINQTFMHGIDPGPGDRVSLVLWGDARPLSLTLGRSHLKYMGAVDGTAVASANRTTIART
jgi:hypothetical protein